MDCEDAQRNQTWRRGRVQRSLRALVRSTSRLQSARRCFELSNASNHLIIKHPFQIFSACASASRPPGPRKGGRLNSAPVTEASVRWQIVVNNNFHPSNLGAEEEVHEASFLEQAPPSRHAGHTEPHRHKGMTLVEPLARCYCSSTRLRRT